MNARDALLGGVAAVALGAGLLGAADKAEAQTTQGTVVTQSTYRPDAAVGVAATSAANCTTTQVSTANLTLTITPPAGQYVYITDVAIEVANNSTGANSQAAWSTTNLTGSPVYLVGEQAAALAGVQQVNAVYPTGLKSTAPGTAVTFVPTATLASAYQCATVSYFTGPQ